MLVTSTEWSCCMELPLAQSEFLLQTLLKHFPAVQTARSPSVTSQLPENRDSVSQDRLWPLLQSLHPYPWLQQLLSSDASFTSGSNTILAHPRSLHVLSLRCRTPSCLPNTRVSFRFKNECQIPIPCYLNMNLDTSGSYPTSFKGRL